MAAKIPRMNSDGLMTVSCSFARMPNIFLDAGIAYERRINRFRPVHRLGN